MKEQRRGNTGEREKGAMRGRSSCVIGSEAAGRHLCVPVQRRGEGHTSAQRFAQLLSKLVFLCHSAPVSL